jgi:hypothetical protein
MVLSVWGWKVKCRKQADIVAPARVSICAPGHLCHLPDNVRQRTEVARPGDHYCPMNSARTCAEQLKSLTDCGDVASLRTAVQELCAEFGKITHMDVLTIAEARRRRALCLLRLESAAQEQQLMKSLSASRFGDDVLIVVDLHTL